MAGQSADDPGTGIRSPPLTVARLALLAAMLTPAVLLILPGRPEALRLTGTAALLFAVAALGWPALRSRLGLAWLLRLVAPTAVAALAYGTGHVWLAIADYGGATASLIRDLAEDPPLLAGLGAAVLAVVGSALSIALGVRAIGRDRGHDILVLAHWAAVLAGLHALGSGSSPGGMALAAATLVALVWIGIARIKARHAAFGRRPAQKTRPQVIRFFDQRPK